MVRRGIRFLRFQFIPMRDIGIMDTNLGPHLGKLTHHHFTAAVTSIADILTITGSANQNIRAGDIAPYIS